MQPSALLAAAALLFFFCVIDAQNASPIVLVHWSFDGDVNAHSRGIGWNTTQLGNNSCSPASAPTCDTSVTPAHGVGFLSTVIYASLNTSADNYYLLQNTSRSSYISIAAYVYLTQIVGAYNILEKRTATELWRLELANGYLSFAFSDVDTNITVTYTSAEQISRNKWQYVTFTCAADTEQVTMSINAQPQSTSSSNSDYVAPPAIEDGIIEFIIGNGGANIDELQLIAGVISGQDTLNLVQHNKLIPPLLHAGYNYDDPFNPLLDRSGNGFHLQLTGVVNTTDGAIKTAILLESQLNSTVSNFMCNPLLGIPLGFTIATYINSDEDFSSLITISNENQTLFALDIAPLNNSVFVSFNNVSTGIVYSPQPWAHIAIVVDAITSQLSVYNDANLVYSTYVNLASFCLFASQNDYTFTLGGIYSSRGGSLRRLLSTGGTSVDQTSVYGTPFTPTYIYYTMNTGANCFSDIGCSSYQLPFDYNLTNLVTGINASADCAVAGTQTAVALYGISSTSKFGPGSLQNLGSCSQSVDLSIGSSTTSSTSDMTLNMWVLLPPSTGQQSYILYGTASTGTFNVAYYPNKALVKFTFPGFTTIAIPTAVTAQNVWHQLSIVFSWELQSAQVLWDGIVYSTSSSVASFSISTITIGNTFTSQFTGLVDAFSIYNLYFDSGLLNFLQTYNTIFPCWSVPFVPPPVVWIPLQNSFVDISNSTHNATINGTVSGYDFATTSTGQIVWSQQPTSYGAEGGLVIESFVVPTVFSASVWVNSNTNTDCRFFLGEPGGTTGYDGGTPGGFGLGICPYSEDVTLPTLLFQVSVYADGEQQDIELGYNIPVSFPVNTWINLVATLDVYGYAALYMNGSLVTSSQLLSSPYLTAWQTAARQPVTIGFNGINSQNPNVYYTALSGYIQDVLIFSYALNATQAAALYNAGFNDAVGSCQQACSPGTYSSSGYASVGQCTPCPANTYTNLYAARRCQACPSDYGTNSTGSTVCYPLCPVGTSAPDGITNCQPCESGKNSTTIGSQQCWSLCVAGRASLDGTNRYNCYGCNAGNYSSQPGSTSCSNCPAGEFSNGLLNRFCHNCTVGSISLDRINCYCQPGYESRVPSDNGLAPCIQCVQGEYADGYGNGNCRSCPIGTTTGAGNGTLFTNISQCNTCAVNYNSSTGFANASTGCVPCPFEYYNNVTGSTTCQYSSLCQPGSFSKDGTIFAKDGCELCSPGQFANVSGQTQCYSCPNGTNSTVSGSSQCWSLCAIGTYSSDGTIRTMNERTFCDECPRGTYSIATGSTNCSYCGHGFWSSDGTIAATCQECPVNFYSETGASTFCTACPVGTSTVRNGSRSCESCPADPSIAQCGQFTCGNNFAIGFDSIAAQLLQVDMTSSIGLQSYQSNNPSTSNFTITAWIYPEFSPVVSNQYISSQDGVFRTIFNGTNQQVGVILPLYMNAYVFTTVAGGILYNTWTHFATTISQTSSSINLSIYVNGTLNVNVIQSQVSGYNGNPILINYSQLAVGKSAVFLGTCMSSVPDISQFYSSPDPSIIGMPGVVPCDTLPALLGLLDVNGQIQAQATTPNYFLIDTFVNSTVTQSLAFNQLVYSIYSYALSNPSIVSLWNLAANLTSVNITQLQVQFNVYDQAQSIINSTASTIATYPWLTLSSTGFFNGLVDEVTFHSTVMTASQINQIAFQPLFPSTAVSYYPNIILLLQFEDLFTNISVGIGAGLAYSMYNVQSTTLRQNDGPICYPSSQAQVGFVPSFVNESLVNFAYPSIYSIQGLVQPSGTSYSVCAGNSSNWGDGAYCYSCPYQSYVTPTHICSFPINSSYLSLPGYGFAPSRPPNSTDVFGTVSVNSFLNIPPSNAYVQYELQVGSIWRNQFLQINNQLSQLQSMYPYTPGTTSVGDMISNCTFQYMAVSQLLLSSVTTIASTINPALIICIPMNQLSSIATNAVSAVVFTNVSTALQNSMSILSDLPNNQVDIQIAFLLQWNQIYGSACLQTSAIWTTNIFAPYLPSQTNVVSTAYVITLLLLVNNVYILTTLLAYWYLPPTSVVEVLDLGSALITELQILARYRVNQFPTIQDYNYFVAEARSNCVTYVKNIMVKIAKPAVITACTAVLIFLDVELFTDLVESKNPAYPTARLSDGYTTPYCNPGSYFNATSAEKCPPCLDGTTSGYNVTSCTPCWEGSFSVGGAACSPCSAGYYSTLPGSSQCTPCPSGMYSPFINQSTSATCTSCGLGNYCPSGSANPLPCPTGTYSASLTSSSCNGCPIGTYGPNTRSAYCMLCNDNSVPSVYSVNNTVCASCSSGKYSYRGMQCCVTSTSSQNTLYNVFDVSFVNDYNNFVSDYSSTSNVTLQANAAGQLQSQWPILQDLQNLYVNCSS